MIVPLRRLVGFHLLSGIVHGLIIWLVVIPLWEKRQDVRFDVRFRIEDPPKPPPIKKRQPKPQKPPVKKEIVTPPKKPVVVQKKPIPPPVSPLPQEEILSSPMGDSEFRVPGAPPAVATEIPEVVETPPPAKGPPPVSSADLDVTKLPDAELREQQNMTVYYEADTYILFAGDDKTGIPVPGPDLCVDGAFLRTIERQRLTHTMTDLEQCWYDMEDGDHDRLICPRSAETTKIYFNDYFRSLIEYDVNHCLEYDNSHCDVITVDSDTPDEEICKIDFTYEGIWADGTNFDYRCTKSETRMFRNPLEYMIRYMEIPLFDDERSDRPKRFHEVVRSIPQCKK